MKGKLRLDELKVETFATASDPAGRGTVNAYERTEIHCSDGGHTCAFDCALSLRHQRECAPSEICQGTGTGGWDPTAFAC